MPLAATRSALLWRIAGVLIEMPAATKLDVSALRTTEIGRWTNRIGCVAVEFEGRRRYVPWGELTALDSGAAQVIRAAMVAEQRKVEAERDEYERAKAFDAELIRQIDEGSYKTSGGGLL